MRSRLKSDSGAVAVEFALIALPLLLLVLGIIDFGRVYSNQVGIAAAAREGVRVMAINNDQAAARTAVKNALPGLSPAVTDAQITISPASCVNGQTVTLTVTYPIQSITGMYDPILNGKNHTAVGAMRCGG